MCQLLESIRIENGVMMNLEYHQRRINESSKNFNHNSFDLKQIIIPDNFRIGLVKLRIVYSDKLESIEFENYKMREIKSLKIVENNQINYHFKYLDRTEINELFNLKENCDDILIAKNGFITDTSYANIVFSKNGEYFTPKTPLLAGTMRQYLLDNGLISQIPIKILDFDKFENCKIINAMIKLEESPVITKVIF